MVGPEPLQTLDLGLTKLTDAGLKHLPDAEGAKMTGLHQRFLGLCLPPILFCVLDFTLTLIFQPRILAGRPDAHYRRLPDSQR